MSVLSTIVLAPAEARSRREVAYLGATLVPAIAAFVLALAGVAAAMLSIVGIGLPLFVAVLALARLVGSLFARPARATVGWTWSRPVPLAARRPFGRAAELVRNGDAWRSLLYCGLKLPISALGVYGAAVGYVVGAAGVTYPAWWIIVHANAWPYGHRPWLQTWVLAAQGAALLLATPWFVRVVVGLDHALVQRLLAPNPAPARIAALEASRAALADDAVATLRRIERDLHDGTQAQLVALGITLSRLDQRVTDPEVRAIVVTARQQVLDALEELRETIRGVHPPALDDGLPTALATLAARSPLPVEVHDALVGPLTDAQATALYFCAAELLTNVARHARARRACIDLRDTDDGIQLTVHDDGRGGATVAAKGTGLSGIERRVRALDGTMTIDSPPHGPTGVIVTLPKEAPCE